MTAPVSSTRPKRGNESKYPVPKKVESGRHWVDLRFDANYSKAHENTVYLSVANFQKIFKGCRGPSFLEVSNNVYKVCSDESVHENILLVSEIFFRDIVGAHHNLLGVWVSPYQEPFEAVTPLTSVIFNVAPIDSWSVDNRVITHQLIKLIREKLQESVLKINQSFFIYYPSGIPLSITVTKWESEKAEALSGKLAAGTQMTLSSSVDEFPLYEEVPSAEIEKLCFRLTMIKHVFEKSIFGWEFPGNLHWKRGVQPAPLICPYYELLTKVAALFKGQSLVMGQAGKFLEESGWEMEWALSEVVTVNSNTCLSGKKLYVFEEKIASLETHRDLVFVQSLDQACPSKELIFKVQGVHIKKFQGYNPKLFLGRQELFKALLALNRVMFEGGQVVVEVNDVIYLLGVVSASGESLDAGSGSFSKIFKITDQTKVWVYTEETDQVRVVESLEAAVSKYLKVEVTKGGRAKPSPSCGPDLSQDEPMILLSYDELYDRLRKALLSSKDSFSIGQELTAITIRGEALKFKFMESSLGETLPDSCSDRLWKLTEETVVQIEGVREGGVMVITPPAAIDCKAIKSKFLEFGIGGVSDQLSDILSRMILSRSAYASHMAALGQSPSRGLLLYGPPGTGKTLIARKLGEILGVSKERIKLYTGSQVWKKFLGESESMVRGMFKEAREDLKRYGNRSPLHLLIIDEVDALLRSRSESSQRYETSVVNTFLAELDGLASNGSESLNNIIVVGLTNRPDSLDEAVKRPGRLFPSLEIAIPDSAGRKEIISVHTRLLQKGGFLTDEFSLEALSRMTAGKTGAFIEGVVRVATEYSFKRVYEAGISVEELKERPEAKVTWGDFEQAFLDCMGKKDRAITLTPLSDRIDLPYFEEELKQRGLAGLDRELLRFMVDIRLTQLYKTHLYTMNQTTNQGCTRALFLSGESGMGKSSLVKAMQSLYGLDSSHFHYLQPKALWPLEGGEFKKRVKDILSSVAGEAKDLKEEAPLHLLVIDELDQVLFAKNESSLHDTSTMSRVLREFEGLVEEYADCHNLLIIGLGHGGPLDHSEVTIRSGRLIQHLAMKPLDLKAREDIFTLYLDKTPHTDEVSAKTLAFQTEGRTGAFIQAIVQNAQMRALRRAAELGLDATALGANQRALVTQEDLLSALEEFKKNEHWRSHMFS